MKPLSNIKILEMLEDLQDSVKHLAVEDIEDKLQEIIDELNIL